MVHFKRQLSFGSKHTGGGEQILITKKGNMSIDKYTNVFFDKIEFYLRIIPDELSKIDRYAKVLP